MAHSEIFSALTADDFEHLGRQREAIRALIRRVFGEDRAPDIAMLQRLIDAGSVAPEDTWRLQALGVCFGDVLIERAPLKWVIIEDEWGRDPTLRWEESTVNLNALTIIAKRIERGEHSDLEYLAEEILQKTRALVEKFAT